MSEFVWTTPRLRVLTDLDFSGVVRCETRPAPGLTCKDEARFSARCMHCRDLEVFCASHMQERLSSVNDGGQKVWCRGCKQMAEQVGTLFRVEALG